jgi:four helix bundle protein
MSTFRTLELAIQFYDSSENLSIKGNLRDQLLRAAASIALNLSEGNAKPSIKEKKRYYQTAYTSCQECKTILRLAKNPESKVDQMVDHLGASIYKLFNSKLTTIRVPNSDSGRNTVNG